MAALLAPGADICGDGAQGRARKMTVALACRPPDLRQREQPEAERFESVVLHGTSSRSQTLRTTRWRAGGHRATPPRLRATRARPQFPRAGPPAASLAGSGGAVALLSSNGVDCGFAGACSARPGSAPCTRPSADPPHRTPAQSCRQEQPSKFAGQLLALHAGERGIAQRLTRAGAASGGALPSRAPAVLVRARRSARLFVWVPCALRLRLARPRRIRPRLRLAAEHGVGAHARSFIRERRGEDRRDPLGARRGSVPWAEARLAARLVSWVRSNAVKRPAQNRRSVRRCGSHQRATDLFAAGRAGVRSPVGCAEMRGPALAVRLHLKLRQSPSVLAFAGVVWSDPQPALAASPRSEGLAAGGGLHARAGDGVFELGRYGNSRASLLRRHRAEAGGGRQRSRASAAGGRVAGPRKPARGLLALRAR